MEGNSSCSRRPRPLPVVETCSILEDDEISMISIDLTSTPTSNSQDSGDKMLSNSLAADEKLLDNVDLLD